MSEPALRNAGTPSIKDVARRVTAGLTSERERAVALHDHVRDTVAFGFNSHFDAGPPEYVLSRGVGHCNPKSQLMTALFRAAGFDAYQHFVAIPNTILRGTLPASRSWLLPAVLCHSYVDVLVDGRWCAIDSFIVDTPLLNAAKAKLAAEGVPLGYGIRVDSTNEWDGRGDAFSQFSRELMLDDHGRIDDLEAYFGSPQYRHKLIGVRFNTAFKLMGDLGVGPINAHLDRLRRGEAN